MITLLPQGKGSPVNSIRIHEPMRLYNPFGINHRLSQSDVNAAYKAFILNRIKEGDKLIIADMDAIAAAYLADDLTLIGAEHDCNVILEIIREAINE